MRPGDVLPGPDGVSVVVGGEDDIDRLENRGIRALVVGAAPGNSGAAQLYERRGFTLNLVYLTRLAARRGGNAR